ncbi:MAG: FtsW/RodA/SpoVE family cell cycle protein [Cellulosilyticaceae bacterium]
MGYLNLMILLSRYIFAGFGLIFILVCFSFMKPFISYPLGNKSSKNHFLYICLLFFHLTGSSILLAKAVDAGIRIEVFIGSLVVFLLFTVSTWLLRLFKHHDQLILWNIVFFLLDVGYIMLERLDHRLAMRQVAWMVFGILAAIILPVVLRRLLAPKYQWLYLACGVVCMLLPFIFGEAKNGAINWVSIGPIAFQPSEFGKVFLVLYLSASFAKWHDKKYTLKNLMVVCGAMGFFMICLVFQRDLGGALLYYLLFLVLILVATQKYWYPVLGLMAGGVAAMAGYFLFGHVRVRVEAWLDPWADISGKGYQVVQGLFAMGTWGWFGSGLTRGIPDKIPIATTDYIFAALCEEFGNLFGIVVILCYLGIVLQGFAIVLRQKTPFNVFVTLGFSSIVGFQSLIILGGVLKLIPLTGITLPFVSYGGTSMIVSLGMIGILTILSYESTKTTKITKITKTKERGK